MDDDADMDDDLRSADPDVGCNKRAKVRVVGDGPPVADVVKHQDQRRASKAELEAEAAAIQQDMLDGIVGSGCTGYVYSLR